MIHLEQEGQCGWWLSSLCFHCTAYCLGESMAFCYQYWPVLFCL